jgi:hypothetical protein
MRHTTGRNTLHTNRLRGLCKEMFDKLQIVVIGKINNPHILYNLLYKYNKMVGVV